MLTVQALMGLALAHVAVWWASERRGDIPWRVVGGAIVFQAVIAALISHTSFALDAFDLINRVMAALMASTQAGSQFVFGWLVGGQTPFTVENENASFILALHALPIVIVMSALSRVLTYWGLIPWIVGALGKLIQRSFRIGGALAFSSAANLFVGMLEAPLLVRHYLQTMSRGELLALMVSGMATIAGTVFVLYVSILAPVIENAAGHVLTASIMSIPAALAYSLMLNPPTGDAEQSIRLENEDASTFDALTTGTADGLRLYLNIVAVLLVFVAIVHLINAALGLIPLDSETLSLQRVLGWLMAPVCWLMGIAGDQALAAGELLGTKIVLNELIAYLQLAQMPDAALNEHTRLILTYALCGFANFGSMGMLVGALTVLAPERRQEILELGFQSLWLGVLATCSTGAVVGMIAG